VRGTQELAPRSRILTLMALVLAAYVVLLGRLAYWQVWRHSDMARLAAAYHDDTITLPAVRGNILDRNGALLVTNTPVFSIFASPDLLSAAARTEVSTRLAPLLQLSAADIQAKLATTRQFVYLARRVPSSVAQQLDAMRLPGIGKVAETQRSYVDGGVPGTTLAANLLGFANDAGQGNYGVEGYYNKTLAGQAGFEATVRDLANSPIVSSLYEPGSVMKVVTLSGALDDRAITPDTRFNETGVAVVGGVAIRNWDNRAHGNVTMTQVLQNSLNVGAIKAQQMEGAGP